MTFPKFIPVNITFPDDERQFGGFCYDRRDNEDFNGRKIKLPSFMRGSKHLGVRFWKNKGEGLMTQIDKEHGYSYESRYAILGMVTWRELHAEKLPKWAIPTDYTDFSLNALPMYSSDLDKQLD